MTMTKIPSVTDRFPMETSFVSAASMEVSMEVEDEAGVGSGAEGSNSDAIGSGTSTSRTVRTALKPGDKVFVRIYQGASHGRYRGVVEQTGMQDNTGQLREWNGLKDLAEKKFDEVFLMRSSVEHCQDALKLCKLFCENICSIALELRKKDSVESCGAPVLALVGTQVLNSSSSNPKKKVAMMMKISLVRPNGVNSCPFTPDDVMIVTSRSLAEPKALSTYGWI